MSAFARIGDIVGAATDQGHKDWTLIQSMSAGISRSIPGGAKDMERTRGETSLTDVVLVRELDKSSTKLQEACAAGTFFPEVEIHFCTDIKGKAEPYLKYLLKDCIVSSYSFSGTSTGNPLPVEQISLNFSEAEWTYVVIDPKTGDVKGNVAGKYVAGENKAG